MIEQRKIHQIAKETASVVRTTFDVFGSHLPDEAFERVFDQPRQRNCARSICKVPPTQVPTRAGVTAE
jgi:hypothetical protein